MEERYHSAVINSEQWAIRILRGTHYAAEATSELSVKLLSNVATSMGVCHVDSLVRPWPHCLYNSEALLLIGVLHILLEALVGC